MSIISFQHSKFSPRPPCSNGPVVHGYVQTNAPWASLDRWPSAVLGWSPNVHHLRPGDEFLMVSPSTVEEIHRKILHFFLELQPFLEGSHMWYIIVYRASVHKWKMRQNYSAWKQRMAAQTSNRPVSKLYPQKCIRNNWHGPFCLRWIIALPMFDRPLLFQTMLIALIIDQYPGSYLQGV